MEECYFRNKNMEIRTRKKQDSVWGISDFLWDNILQTKFIDWWNTELFCIIKRLWMKKTLTLRQKRKFIVTINLIRKMR